jgi:hypothetical protein
MKLGRNEAVASGLRGGDAPSPEGESDASVALAAVTNWFALNKCGDEGGAATSRRRETIYLY